MSKKIIICADGTWNSEHNRDNGKNAPTNVVKIARSVLPEDHNGMAQIVHYESGVGTDLSTRFVGGAFGVGLFENVRACYRFIVLNFMPGDQLYFFGFSRGAYTVRSLAGLIRNCGILKRGHEVMEEEALRIYRSYDENDSPGGSQAIQFRADNSVDAGIHLIGVWDTVGALGIPGFDDNFRLAGGMDWQFHDVTLSQSVRHAYQALAIHEHRAEFTPALWQQQKLDAGVQQTLEQVWFSGAHSDVGGGYEFAGLSDVALEWMVKRANAAGLATDLTPLSIFDPKYNPNPLADGHDSFSALYKLMNTLRFKPKGILRTFENKARTNQSIDGSVIKRFKKEQESKKWPPSFYTKLGGN